MVTETPANKISIDQDETAPTGKPVSPVPPRYWWLKRTLLVSAALFVVLLGVRLWWGWEADRRLQAEIDRIIAAGEPLYPADFDPEPMRPEENAAKLYLDAEAVLNLNPTQGDFVRKFAGEYAEIGERLDEIEPFILANAETFDLVRQAGELDKFDWGTRIRTPAINFLLPNLVMHRHLSKTLSIAATYHAAKGNDAQALQTLVDSFRLSRAIDHEPYLIGHLIGIANRAVVARDIEHIAPTLAITLRPGERDGSPMVAPRELVVLLIAELLDDKGFEEAHVRAMQSERMMTLDTVETVLRGDFGVSSMLMWGAFGPQSLLELALSYPLEPLFVLDSLAGVQFGSAVVASARKLDWPAARSTLPPELSDWSALDRLTRPISALLIPSLRRAVFLHFRALAITRMAAIALAIRLYEVDHGQRPETLSELVPEYLPAIPIDPMAADGEPIRYLPHATKPILYSVGENGIDDGGGYAIASHGGFDRKSLDRIFFLDGDRPRRKRESNTDADESSESNDDGDEVERDGGESK